LEYKSILQSIKERKFSPVYFLHGDEPYYIDKIANAMENGVLSESEKSFNQSILYGHEVDFKAVMDSARRFPMMSDYQLVMIKEAQKMTDIIKLEEYVKNPLASTILVICYKFKKLDQRTSFAKAIGAKGVVFESKVIYDNQVGGWIQQYVTDHGFKIESQAAEMAAEFIGNDLSTISNEFKKMFLNIDKSKPINPETVLKYIGIHKEYNVFELQKALGARQIPQTLRIVQYFRSNPKDFSVIMVISMFYNYFTKAFKLHFLTKATDAVRMQELGMRSEFFMKEYKQVALNYNRTQMEQIFELLRIYDLKSKGVDADNISDGELLAELVLKIIYL
jgi:DNA polymerase III subunit delta